MPIIFASALLIIPSLLGGALGWDWISDTFSAGRGFWYVTLYALLIFFFYDNMALFFLCVILQ